MHDDEEHLDTSNTQRARRRPGQRMKNKAERAATQDTFLKALSNTANTRAACIQAGIHPSLVYQWQEHDPEFGMRFQQANKDANLLLFGEAWRRAMQGEEEVVVSAGKVVYKDDGTPLTIRRKSDRLLELLLKARLPEFRDKGATIVTILPKEYLFDANSDGVEKE